MASVLQAAFSLSAFQTKYDPNASDWAQTHTLTCPNPAPADCVECQMIKIADGLLSGRYAKKATSSTVSDDDPNAPKFQEGLKPSMFKALVGKGHAEFATMKQQDAEEFFVHLIDVLRRESRRRAGGPGSGNLTIVSCLQKLIRSQMNWILRASSVLVQKNGFNVVPATK